MRSGSVAGSFKMLPLMRRRHPSTRPMQCRADAGNCELRMRKSTTVAGRIPVLYVFAEHFKGADRFQHRNPPVHIEQTADAERFYGRFFAADSPSS